MKPCKIWPWTLDKEGYAITTNHYRQVRVAKAVLEDFLGRPLEKGEVTRHLCHNKACVEVTHLAPGTARDNYLDNYRAGKKHPGQKLTDEAVREIRRLRAAGVTMAKLAELFDIAGSTVCYIVNGQRKKHVK